MIQSDFSPLASEHLTSDETARCECYCLKYPVSSRTLWHSSINNPPLHHQPACLSTLGGISTSWAWSAAALPQLVVCRFLKTCGVIGDYYKCVCVCWWRVGGGWPEGGASNSPLLHLCPASTMHEKRRNVNGSFLANCIHFSNSVGLERRLNITRVMMSTITVPEV